MVIASTTPVNSVFLSSYRTTIVNQSVRIFSGGYLLKVYRDNHFIASITPKHYLCKIFNKYVQILASLFHTLKCVNGTSTSKIVQFL